MHIIVHTCHTQHSVIMFPLNFQAVIIHNIFYCLGHSNNVYDDDDDSSDAVWWSERGSLCVAEHYRVTTHPCSVCLHPSVLWHCWLGGRKGIRPVKNWVWCAVVVVCLELGADLHVAQLMSLPLTVSCFSKIQIGFTFLVPAHLGSPRQRAVKRVCVYTSMQWYCAADAVARQLTWRKSMTYSSPTLWNSQSVVLRPINLLPFWLVCTAQLQS